MSVDLSKAAFSSEYRYEYIGTKGHQAFTTTGGSPNVATVIIAHSLGYIPFFRVYFQFQGDSNYYTSYNGPIIYLGTDFWVINSIQPSTTTLTVSINPQGSTSVLTGTVFYRIYAEPQAA